MLRKNVKSLLEQFQVCIFAEIVFGVRCTLNHHGHCINYWECEQSDIKLAEISLNQFEEEDGYYQATLPSNIASGSFMQGELIQRTWVSLRGTLARSEDEC